MLPELLGLMAIISRPSGVVGNHAVTNVGESDQLKTSVASANVRQGVKVALSSTDGRPYPPPPPPPALR